MLNLRKKKWKETFYDTIEVIYKTQQIHRLSKLMIGGGGGEKG